MRRLTSTPMFETCSKRGPPSVKKFPVNGTKVLVFDARSRQNVLWVLMRSYSIPSFIPSWAGF